jgi:hypothetical protein
MNNIPRILVGSYVVVFFAISAPVLGEGAEGEANAVETVDATAEDEAVPPVAAEEIAEETVVTEPVTAEATEEVAAVGEERVAAEPEPTPTTEDAVQEPAPITDVKADLPAGDEPAEVIPDGGNKVAEEEAPEPAPAAQSEPVVAEVEPPIMAEKKPAEEPLSRVASKEKVAAKGTSKNAGSIASMTKKDAPFPSGDEKDQSDLMGAPAVVAFMQKKEMQLVEARVEIARLKDIIKKIAEVNRRERAAMHYNLGCAYKAAGDSRKAEAELLKAAELDPHDAVTHYNLGILYDDDLKDKKKAKEHYEKYLLLAPNSKDAPSVLEWMKSL